MRFSQGLQLAQRLMNVGMEAVALEIVDLLDMRDHGYKLQDKDRFVLGLLYYEFFATSDNDISYDVAREKRNKYLELLQINFKDLYNTVEKLLGRNNFII